MSPAQGLYGIWGVGSHRVQGELVTLPFTRIDRQEVIQTEFRTLVDDAKHRRITVLSNSPGDNQRFGVPSPCDWVGAEPIPFA